ncbi:MAG: hypothetical protein OJI67_13110 [Prosthecobacter sp.]|nr:hypothetical protein [Prosthecobacter sp.]
MFDFLRFGRSKAKTLSPEAASDYGRIFGWFIERGGERVGELEYIRWDDTSQFWHDYKVLWRNPEDARVHPNDWICDQKIILRNRRYLDVVEGSFLVGSARGDNNDILPIRGAYVPKERLRADPEFQI